MYWKVYFPKFEEKALKKYSSYFYRSSRIHMQYNNYECQTFPPNTFPPRLFPQYISSKTFPPINFLQDFPPQIHFLQDFSPQYFSFKTFPPNTFPPRRFPSIHFLQDVSSLVVSPAPNIGVTCLDSLKPFTPSKFQADFCLLWSNWLQNSVVYLRFLFIMVNWLQNRYRRYYTNDSVIQ